MVKLPVESEMTVEVRSGVAAEPSAVVPTV